MDKYIYDEKNGLWYRLQGDYYLPCLKLPEEVEVHIGVGTASPPVSESIIKLPVYSSADKRQAEQIPCRYRSASGRTVLLVGNTMATV